MTVYVDDAHIPATVRGGRARHTSTWCHLFADTQDELHLFAARLGLRRSCFQPGRPRGDRSPSPYWHYDVTATKRQQALRLGAQAVTQPAGKRPESALTTRACGSSPTGTPSASPRARRSQSRVAPIRWSPGPGRGPGSAAARSARPSHEHRRVPRRDGVHPPSRPAVQACPPLHREYRQFRISEGSSSLLRRWVR